MDSTTLNGLKNFLFDLLATGADQEGLNWLSTRAERIRNEGQERIFYLTFSAVPRFLGKIPVKADGEALRVADNLRRGFWPQGWTTDRLARVWLLLQWPHKSSDDFVHSIEMLFDTADMGELIALYSSLPLLPYPERFVNRATEGVRTNMVVVFDAIALDNPYPADYLGESAWNQMVLKAAFMDRPLYRIIGLDARANLQLARIISDYAHERWAAGRIVSPELWRPVGHYLDTMLLQDVQRLFRETHPLQQQAAALLCYGSNLPEARELLNRHPPLREAAAAGTLTWDSLAANWWKEKERTANE